MAPFSRFRDLDVWQRGIDLTVGVYALTSGFPKHELYGLTSQIRRAAVSIVANIAEGNGRMYRGDYVHHASIARGSVAELMTLLELAKRLEYAGAAELEPLFAMADAVSAMLTRLIRSLRNSTKLKW